MRIPTRTRHLLAAAAWPAAIASSLAQAQAQPYDGSGHMWGGGWGFMLGPLAMLLTVAAVVVLVVLIIRWLGGPTHTGHAPGPHAAPPRTALDILRDRFARGEIDREEFEERRRILEQ